jgi:chromosome segregation ATPase
MTEHKFTDDEIIKALECCSRNVPLLNSCEDCPFYGKRCAAFLPQVALDLIKRYKAENERLERDLKKACKLIECCQEQLDRVKDAYGIRETTALEAIINVHMLTLKKYLDTGEQYIPDMSKIPAADVVPRAEIEELQSEIKILKDSNINLQELYQTEREKVAKAKQKVIDIGRALKTAKAEAIKEFAEIIVSDYPEMEYYLTNLAKEMTEGES